MRVLVALDGSEQSEAALEQALELFPNADVHVLHVIQVKQAWGDETKTGYELSVAEGETVIDRAQATASDRGRTITTTLTEGNAAKTILSYAQTHDIDHILMGSTGRSGLSRVLLGSVAESVTRRAPCSVTIVRHP